MSINEGFNIEDCGYTFEDIVPKNPPLIPNGDKIVVTKENFNQYLKLNKLRRLQQLARQFNAIREGILQIVPYSWFSHYSKRDLEEKISGSVIDIQPDY